VSQLSQALPLPELHQPTQITPLKVVTPSATSLPSTTVSQFPVSWKPTDYPRTKSTRARTCLSPVTPAALRIAHQQRLPPRAPAARTPLPPVIHWAALPLSTVRASLH